MRAAQVFYNQILAGILTEENRDAYCFVYDDTYFRDTTLPAISLTFPKSKKEFQAGYLFPFFYNMLAEGANRILQSRQLRIDEEDSFGFLLATAGYDTIGAITVKPIEQWIGQ
jgi:HipA-like protein